MVEKKENYEEFRFYVRTFFGLQGEVLRLFDVDPLIDMLNNPNRGQSWEGKFQLFDNEDVYVFRSPDFRWEKIDY